MLNTLTTFGFSANFSRVALVAVKNASLEAAMDWMNSNEAVEKNLAAESAAAGSGGNGSDAKKKKKPRMIPLELQRLFTQLQMLNQRSISTEGKSSEIIFFLYMCNNRVVLMNVSCRFDESRICVEKFGRNGATRCP